MAQDASRISLLASIIDSFEDAIISKTPEGVITSWNPAAEPMFGCRAEEIIGKPVSILEAPERQGEMAEILERIRKGQRIEHYETRRRRKDGSLIYVSLTVSVMREICGDKLDEQCQGYLREAYEGTWRMNRLIDTLLNFSIVTKAELRRVPVALDTLAHEVATELHLSEPQRPIQFRIAQGITVDGDASLLRVVLENLLGNAWKYTANQEEQLIEFGVRQIDGKQTYFVRDNGMGFDMANAEKLFVAFQRLPGTEEFKGFGIDLATVERIIRRHGGRVWAEGEPGKGACVYFTLPADGVSK